jgi:hypothetical protein
MATFAPSTRLVITTTLNTSTAINDNNNNDNVGYGGGDDSVAMLEFEPILTSSVYVSDLDWRGRGLVLLVAAAAPSRQLDTTTVGISSVLAVILAIVCFLYRAGSRRYRAKVFFLCYFRAANHRQATQPSPSSMTADFLPTRHCDDRHGSRGRFTFDCRLETPGRSPRAGRIRLNDSFALNFRADRS